MEHVSNREKAIELSSTNRYGFSIKESNAAYNAALAMAEWKDEQEIEFLQSLKFHATYYIFDRINERIKLLKGEQQ